MSDIIPGCRERTNFILNGYLILLIQYEIMQSCMLYSKE